MSVGLRAFETMTKPRSFASDTGDQPQAQFWRTPQNCCCFQNPAVIIRQLLSFCLASSHPICGFCLLSDLRVLHSSYPIGGFGSEVIRHAVSSFDFINLILINF